MDRMPVAVVGAGLIGRTHADRAARHADVRLVAICDPAPAARDVAAAFGVPWFAELDAMLDRTRPRGVVVATPNASHAEVALRCLARGSAVIVEKPIADRQEDANRICEAAAAAGQVALVGHQRRYNPIARRARDIILSGRLGRPVCATVLCTWLKPPEYFEVAWRRRPGGGPVLINLIHDIDLLRFLFGELATVQAMASSVVRGFEVEDTAAVLLRFRSGALGTVTVSDTAAAPWNWDLASGEAERFPRQEVSSFFLSGTEASLSLPGLELWDYRGERGWEQPLTVERGVPLAACPYTEQLRHFRAAVEGREPPVCSAADASRSLAAALAVGAAARAGAPVTLPD